MISVIVPVYNSEKTLELCLDSLRRQTYCNMEVVIVDDGSTDRSREICERFAIIDHRFRYIYQKNAGVSAARNRGIAASNGEYIGFCDSDDWVDEDMYQFLLNMLMETGAQISICSFDASKTHAECRMCEDDKRYIYTPQEAITEMLMGKRFAGQSCNKLFCRQVIGDVLFPEGISIFEDTLFCCKAIKNSKRIAFQDSMKYHYINNAGSAMVAYRESYWSIQDACIMLDNWIKNSFPDLVYLAQKTILFGNLILARRLSEARRMTKENYNRILKQVKMCKEEKAVSSLPVSYQRALHVLKRGRAIYNIYVLLARTRSWLVNQRKA